MESLSKLHFYSLGTVAANKPLTSKDIEVTPLETSPMVDGELTDAVASYSTQASDQDGAAYQVDMKTTATIKATWLPIGSSNRMTAPDVRRGETVILYQFADEDRYWWSTLKDDAHLRKLETVIYAFSGTRDESAEPTADNTYFLEVSTHKKVVHFHTSRADNEPFAYDVQINTKDGCITIQDDAGNYFVFDSAERRLIMKNQDESFVDIDKREIKIFAADLIDMTSKKCVQHYERLEITVSDSTEIRSKETLVVSNSKHVGNILLAGNLGTMSSDTGNGDIKMKGNMTVEGNAEIQSNLTVDQQLNAQKIHSPNTIDAPKSW